MTKRFQNRLLRQLSLRGLVTRMFGLALFAWTTVFTPLHLLLEQHSDDSIFQEVSRHQTTVDSDDSDHAHGQHQIHPASDHKIRAACHAPTFAERAPVLSLFSAVQEAPSPCFISLFLVERVNPPGLDLPAPLLPRAPPAS